MQRQLRFESFSGPVGIRETLRLHPRWLKRKALLLQYPDFYGIGSADNPGVAAGDENDDFA